MKIINQNYVAPADAKAAAICARLTTYFAANPGVQSVTFEEIAVRFPADAAGMVQGAIHQAAKDAGWTVQAAE